MVFNDIKLFNRLSVICSLCQPQECGHQSHSDAFEMPSTLKTAPVPFARICLKLRGMPRPRPGFPEGTHPVSTDRSLKRTIAKAHLVSCFHF